MAVTCAFCGEKPIVSKPIVKDGQRFCSPECVEAFDASDEEDEEEEVDDDLEDDDFDDAMTTRMRTTTTSKTITTTTKTRKGRVASCRTGS